MNRAAAWLLPVAMLCPTARSSAQCRLCASDSPTRAVAAPTRALTVEVEAALDFSRATGAMGGEITIDERTGQRRVAGLTDLGGVAIRGSVRLTGDPFARVRVSLPMSVRLTAPDGSAADAVDLRTDLSADPALGPDGTLSFGFGGRLVVRAGDSGDFRGRIAIVADYQ